MDHLALLNMIMRGHITAPLLAASQNEFSGNFFTYPDRQRFRSSSHEAGRSTTCVGLLPVCEEMPFEAYKALQMLQSMDDNESLDPRLRLSLAALGEYFTNVMSVANARFKFIEEIDNTHVPGEWPAGRSSNAHLLVHQPMTDG